MTIAIPHAIDALWGARIYLFRKVYALLTIVVAVGVAWIMRKPEASSVKAHTNAARPPRNSFSAGAVAAAALLLVILAGYVVVALKWEAFADYDESTFTMFTLRGHNFESPIWPATGRLFPLGQQEFNVVRHFTSSVVGYHAVPIAELLIVACLFLFLEDELSIASRLALAAFFLVLPSVVTSFGGLVFPDRNVVFWLASVLAFVKLFERNGSTGWAVAAAICGLNMVFYKETAFLLLLVFAGVRLFLRCRRADREGWDFARLRDRESRLDLCFITVALIFLLYYAAVMFPHPNMQYANQYRVGWGDALFYYLRLDPLAIVFVAVALRRVYLILRRRLEPVAFWDALACSGVAYYAAFIYLRLCRPYYMAPVDFVAVLYIGRLVVLSWDSIRSWSKAAAFAMLTAMLLQSVSLSAFRVYERENMVHASAELADELLAQSQNGAGRVQRLFFPFSSVTPITEFAAYLTYRGINLEGYTNLSKSDSSEKFMIVGPDFSKDAPCVEYLKFVCHAGRGPERGDLVVELPQDLESRAEIDPFRADGAPLFSYDPRPRIPHWMLPALTYLRIASIRWRPEPLPDRWLDASITTWK